MIKINNLTKIYDKKTPQEVTALENVSFSVKKGEVINIVGKSGSGKTTLAKILLGIIKPTEGNINIDNINIDHKTKSKKLRLITNKLLMSFQYPTHQLFTKTVREEILFNSKDDSRLNEIIEEFNFPKDHLDKSPFRLSSGQKRKVILMSVLLQSPEIIIFDEATAFLDPKSRREFIDLIKKINKKYGTTMIFISHNLVDANNFSNRTILLDEGKLIEDGETDKVISTYLGGGNNGK